MFTAREQQKGPTLDKLVREVSVRLHEVCKMKGRHGKINLFEFTLDPGSFSNTVQRLFLTSFVVKKREATIYTKDGIPYIKPLKNDSSSGDGEGPNQSQLILNITKEQWIKLKETLNLEKPVIELSSE